MTTLERELRERLALLGDEQQRQVLEYARALGQPPRGVPGRALMRFAGCITAEDAREIEAVVEEGFEGIDSGGW